MRNEQFFQSNNNLSSYLNGLPVSRRLTVGVILILALIAFEIFNFDTTRYALHNLLGNVRFLGLQWAAILAIAFCSIDFAGLIRLMTPYQMTEESKAVWYLMGAWLLGATMNAVMTWWAISLTLLNHDLGNEVLSRQQLLLYVPIFVAVLVWITRILLIGAFTVAGEHIFDFAGQGNRPPATSRPQSRPGASQPAMRRPTGPARTPSPSSPQRQPTNRPMTTPQARPASYGAPEELYEVEDAPHSPPPSRPVREPHSRVRQRPPRPNGNIRRMPLGGVQARSRNSRN